MAHLVCDSDVAEDWTLPKVTGAQILATQLLSTTHWQEQETQGLLTAYVPSEFTFLCGLLEVITVLTLSTTIITTAVRTMRSGGFGHFAPPTTASPKLSSSDSRLRTNSSWLFMCHMAREYVRNYNAKI